MTWRLFIDSSTGVDVDPEWDLALEDSKIEDQHRALDGSRYVYKWGRYRRWKVPVSFVDSSFRFHVNTWWLSNAQLLWMDNSGSTDVFSVQIVNDSIPVGGYVKPYTDLFAGVIELETF